MTHLFYLILLMAGPADMRHGVAGILCDNRVPHAWHYAWQPTTVVCPYCETVPMIKWQADMGKPIGGNSAWLLGFNEPDRPDQANMTPREAALEWRELEDRHPARKLVSPAVLDVQWLRDWRAEYVVLWGQPPRVDAIGAHVYQRTAAASIANLEAFIALAREWGVPVWVTEFAILPCWPNWRGEATELVQWMRAQPEIARYAWFVSEAQDDAAWLPPWMQGTCNPSLVRDGALTPAGEWYAAIGGELP